MSSIRPSVAAVALTMVVTSGGCASGRMATPDGELEPDVDAATTTGPDARDGGDAGDPSPDGQGTTVDAVPDAPPAVTGTGLLLTELVLQPVEAEFVEIYNPTSQAISLAQYYLADTGTYFRLPAGVTPAATDFLVKFPAGASIGPKAVITVALGTISNFQSTYGGVAPTYSIGSGTMTLLNTPMGATLTNSGEIVVLFTWDGTADLVRDVDIMLAGVPTVANAILDKSGVAIDGPDANTATTAYGDDTRTMPLQTGTPATNQSTKRIAPESGNELQAGSGNGLAGDDETSENTRMTWDSAFSAPTPGAVPIGL